MYPITIQSVSKPDQLMLFYNYLHVSVAYSEFGKLLYVHVPTTRNVLWR